MNGSSYTLGRFIYLKNPMGDVVGLADWQGNLVCTYEYDAWGKMLAVKDATGAVRTDLSFVGNMNPLRYRGYFWDVETGFYYCGSRYYDPAVGRWISADAILDTATYNGCNLYAYCLNNPVNLADPSGYSPALLLEQGIETVQQGDPTSVLVGAGLVLLGLLVIGGAVLVNSISSPAPATSVEGTLGGIAGSFGDEDLSCQDAAEAMKKALLKQDLHATWVTLTFLPLSKRSNFVWSESKQKVISTNGVHIGIMYRGIVYCNIHPNGLPFYDWYFDFMGPHGYGEPFFAPF